MAYENDTDWDNDLVAMKACYLELTGVERLQ